MMFPKWSHLLWYLHHVPCWFFRAESHLRPSGFLGSDLFGNSQALGGRKSFKFVYEGFSNPVVQLSQAMFLLSHSCFLQCKNHNHKLETNISTFKPVQFMSCLISKVSISNITTPLTPLFVTLLRNPTERNSRNLAFATLALTRFFAVQNKATDIDVAPLHQVAHWHPHLIFQ